MLGGAGVPEHRRFDPRPIGAVRPGRRRPTYGAIGRRGVLPLSNTLDHTGPMAWTVEDCALLLQAMAGHDPLDPGTNRPVADFSAQTGKGVKGLRISIMHHFHEEGQPG